MRKVYRAVNRINNPFVFRLLNDLTDLFTEDIMAGIILLDHVHDHFFRRMVHFGNQVVDPFLVGNFKLAVVKTQYLTCGRLHGLYQSAFEHPQK